MTDSIDNKIEENSQPSYDEIDYLKLYYCRPYKADEKIYIYQPTIGEIIDFGENRFQPILYTFVGNTTLFRLQLWDIGQDWNKISNFQLFCSLVTSLSVDETRLLFHDLDFTKFEHRIFADEEENLYDFLINEQDEIVISEEIYERIANYIRTMFNTFPKNEFARGRSTKEAIIEEEREKIELAKKDNKSSTSTYLPLISSCLNHPGFKYKKNELLDVGIFEFMDSVQRLQIYESTTALLKGAYSGMLDTKSINKDEFNFMRDIHEHKD